MEKHLEHDKELYHNFIDFKKAFDPVWHEGLWRVLREYNIDNRLIEVIKSLYDEATSAMLLSVVNEYSNNEYSLRYSIFKFRFYY